jgi:hypothetical protein
MSMQVPQYFIVGIRPIKFVRGPGDSLVVLKMSWDTGAFENGIEYYERALFGRDDAERVTEDEFIQRTEAWRARHLKPGGPVGALYTTMNALEDTAAGQGRELTAEERALLAELRRETYQMFEAEHPDQPAGP